MGEQRMQEEEKQQGHPQVEQDKEEVQVPAVVQEAQTGGEEEQHKQDEEQVPQDEVEEVIEPPSLSSMMAEIKAKAAQRVQRVEEAAAMGGGAGGNEGLEGKGKGASVKRALFKGPRTVAPTAQPVTKAGKPLTKEQECLQQHLLNRRKSLRVNDHEDDEQEEEDEEDDDSWLDE
jgi:hypothetical protein